MLAAMERCQKRHPDRRRRGEEEAGGGKAKQKEADMSGTQTPSCSGPVGDSSPNCTLWDSLHNYADDAATEERAAPGRWPICGASLTPGGIHLCGRRGAYATTEGQAVSPWPKRGRRGGTVAGRGRIWPGPRPWPMEAACRGTFGPWPSGGSHGRHIAEGVAGTWPMRDQYTGGRPGDWHP